MTPRTCTQAITAIACLCATGAWADSRWIPAGDASYEEHQARPVSVLTRAEVMAEFMRSRANQYAWGEIGDTPSHVVAGNATRHEVRQAYLRAAARNRLPQVAEVSADSPAQIAARDEEAGGTLLAAAAAPADPAAPSYANPTDSQMLLRQPAGQPADAADTPADGPADKAPPPDQPKEEFISGREVISGKPDDAAVDGDS